MPDISLESFCSYMEEIVNINPQTLIKKVIRII